MSGATNGERPSGDLRRVMMRQMRADDIAFAMELKTIAGWNQNEKDWRGYLEFEPEGCFVAETGGRPAGTATSIRYGDRFGWIGMVLVHPDKRRLGIGTKLLEQVISYLQSGGTPCVKLDATPMGRKVYVPLGFQEEFELSRFEGVAPGDDDTPDPFVRQLVASDLAAVTAFDTPIFGAERGRVLKSLIQRNPDWCFVVREGSAVRGYLIAREGANAIQLGPWVARDTNVAGRLLRSFFALLNGRRIFVDTPHLNDTGCTLLRNHGFTVQRNFTRMHLGPNRYPGIPDQIFGCSGAEKG